MLTGTPLETDPTVPRVRRLWAVPTAAPTGGEGGIRTHGRVAPAPVFKTGAINRSATSPQHSPIESRILADSTRTSAVQYIGLF